jgi:hypothetical protein
MIIETLHRVVQRISEWDRDGGDLMAVRPGSCGSIIGICLHPRLKAWLEERAEAEGMSVSTLVRTWIVREAKHELRPAEAVDEVNRNDSQREEGPSAGQRWGLEV